MKPKTFTYNQMIRFFNDIKMPLKPEQIAAIGIKHREELDKIAAYKQKKKEKRDKRILKRLKEEDKKEEDWKRTREYCS